MIKALATLDPEGFIKDPAAVASKLTIYFYLANYSQSTINRGKVASLAWLIARHSNDPTQLCRAIERTLGDYLQGWFDEANVAVSVVNPDDSRLNLRLSAIIRVGNESFEYNHLLNTNNKQLHRVIDLVNDNILFDINSEYNP